MKQVVKRYRATIVVVVSLVLAVCISVAVMANCLHITSANAIVYFLRHADGSVEITNHLRPGETSQVERMVNLSRLFFLLAKGEATAGRGRLELTWDERDGNGVIKEFRPGGTEFLIVLSRFALPQGTPQGLFIGGDLPLGDEEQTAAAAHNNTGVAYNDGVKWHHIWCSLNESVSFPERKRGNYGVEAWTYLGSSVKKRDFFEVILESRHELKIDVASAAPVKLFMKRTLQKKLGENYLLLQVEYINVGDVPFSYTWELGDEPWVGDFYRGSRGNVGWSDDGLHGFEHSLSPRQHAYAGYWDIGNAAAGETGHFTGYADFIEWLSGRPDHMYLANAFGHDRVDGRKPLTSWNNRIISLVWSDQRILPGERKVYLLAIGMAGPNYPGERPLPEKPTTRRSIE